MRFRTHCFVFCLGLGAAANAQVSVTAEHTTLSALQDVSNVMRSQTQYNGSLSHSAADPDTYINNFVFAPGTGWDYDLNLNIASGYFSNGYVFGTPISGDQFWWLNSLAWREGQVDNVVAGLYDFGLEFYGGLDNAANDLLATMNLTIEVFPRLELEVTAVASPGVISAGQQSRVSMTVLNNMAQRTFTSTTWYIGGAGGGLWNGSSSLNASWDFADDWWNRDVAAGASRTGGHSYWGASASTPLGTYTGNVGGVVGGLYNGDWHWKQITNQMAVEVVPEPASLAVLGLGALAMLRRRRRA